MCLSAQWRNGPGTLTGVWGAPNRLRNAAEGVVAGGIVEAVGWGIRAARAAKAGDTKAAAKFT